MGLFHDPIPRLPSKRALRLSAEAAQRQRFRQQVINDEQRHQSELEKAAPALTQLSDKLATMLQDGSLSKALMSYVVNQESPSIHLDIGSYVEFNGEKLDENANERFAHASFGDYRTRDATEAMEATTGFKAVARAAKKAGYKSPDIYINPIFEEVKAANEGDEPTQKVVDKRIILRIHSQAWDAGA